MGESRIPNDTGERWRQIALIWAKIATVPLTRPEHAVRLLMKLVGDVLGAEIVWSVLGMRTGDPAAVRKFGAAGEWVPMASVPLDESLVNPDVEAEFRHHRLKHDRWTAGRLEHAGTNRTHIREDILGDLPWSSCEAGWHLEQYGIKDQMVSVHALTKYVELHLGVDRTDGPNWSHTEKEWLHDVNMGLAPFCARLAMSFGMLASDQHLSPRERETFLHLLDGEPEAVIAHRMGITSGTVHQYVVSIFRKFGVTSRSELMAKWLHVGEDELSSEAEIERELASTLLLEV